MHVLIVAEIILKQLCGSISQGIETLVPRVKGVALDLLSVSHQIVYLLNILL